MIQIDRQNITFKQFPGSKSVKNNKKSMQKKDLIVQLPPILSLQKMMMVDLKTTKNRTSKQEVQRKKQIFLKKENLNYIVELRAKIPVITKEY